MPMIYRTLLTTILSAYAIVSPFMWLWFHKNVLKETWNDDLADRVTVRLYVLSNIAAIALAYIVQECEKCG